MPENIGNHGLYCPDFDDYAAVALYMQDLGTRIDEQLGMQRDALSGFLNMPTMIVTSSVTKTVPPGFGGNDIFDTVLFNNAPTFLNLALGTANGNVIQIGSPAGAIPIVAYPRGMWRFGACTRQTSSGAVTAYSKRNLRLILVDNTSATTGTSALDELYDTDTGGDEGQNAKHVGFNLTGTHGVEIQSAVSNTNGVNVDVLAGAYLWVTYSGPTDLIEVA